MQLKKKNLILALCAGLLSMSSAQALEYGAGLSVNQDLPGCTRLDDDEAIPKWVMPAESPIPPMEPTDSDLEKS